MSMKTGSTVTENSVIYFIREDYVNPINKEINPIEVTCEISKDQIKSLSMLNIDVVSHTAEALKSEYKKFKGKNIYEALLKKTNNRIKFSNIEKVFNTNKRYFIIGTLEDIKTFIIDNDVPISINDNDVLKNPMGIFGSIKIGNKKIDVVYLNEKIKNSYLLLSAIKDYDNTYKITF